MEAKLERLHIDPKAVASSNQKKSTVIESWEDDDLSSPIDSDVQTPTEAQASSIKSPKPEHNPALAPPPPTPISPQDWAPANVLGGGRPLAYGSTTRSESDTERRRPEKTTAAAGRMIAAGLGMKIPKKTEEQRKYDRAMKENEMKRRNKEKEGREREEVEAEKARNAVWES